MHPRSSSTLPVPAPRALAPAFAALALAACGRAPQPPDVLLVSLDSVRADFLTFDDATTAPALTRLAERGAVFTQALSGTSWTLPAHAQLFTGNPPTVHGAQIDTLRIDPLHPTLPELLSEAGYATLGFWTGWYLADEFGFARGFDLYQSSMTLDPVANEALRSALEARGDAPEEIAKLMREVSSHEDITSRQLVADAELALAAVPPERPVFLFAHFFDPHYDYVPPPPFDTRFDPDYAGDFVPHRYWDNPQVYDSEAGERRISDRDLEHVRALYRGELAWTDSALADLLRLFEARRGLEHTLVVVTSDHGEEFFEHGGRGHRQTLFDEVLRVPLLVAPPGSGERTSPIAQQVTLSDVLPTVLDYLELPPAKSAYGRSLRPLLEGRALPERPAVSSLLVQFEDEAGGTQYRLSQAVRTPSEKLTRVMILGGPNRLGLGEFRRADLNVDATELTPPPLPPEELRRHWERFEDALDPLRAHFESLPHSKPEDRATRARERFAEELGALGYANASAGSAESAEPEAPRWLWKPPKRLAPPD